MNLFCKTDWRDAPDLMLISLGLLLLPVSNAAGQIPLYAAGLFWLSQLCRRKVSAEKTTWILLGGWILLILISLTYAAHPELGIRKLSRLLIFPLTGAVTSSCLAGPDFQARVRFLCKSLLLGVFALGVYDLIRFPLIIYGGTAFEDVGNMTSPQFHLVGLMLWLGLISLDRGQVRKIWWLGLPLLLAGLMLHQKRGVWLAAAATVGLWTLWNRKWKTLAAMGVLAVVLLCLPFVQARLQHIEKELQANHGGRRTLWTEVAPRMFREYPWGMGYNGSKYEDFREILPDDLHLEVGLRHLHNNFLQIRLELGWPGVFWWTLWMGLVFARAFSSGPQDRARADVRILQTAVAFAFVGLFLNGLVEYNFGRTETHKMYLVIFGLVDAFHLKSGGKGIPGPDSDLKRQP